MTRFALTIVSDDRVILSTEEAMSREDMEEVAAKFDDWRRDGRVALILSDCEVRDVRQAEIELELGAVAEAEVRHERLSWGDR